MDKQIIKDLLKKENPIILEIGTDDGKDSMDFLETFKKIQLYCFEPNPESIEVFKNRIQQDERCKLFKYAISDKDGETVFWISKHSTGQSSIKKPTAIKYARRRDGLRAACYKKSMVKTKRLDTWTEENNIEHIDFIWADVEGAERELIQGGLETLNTKTKYLYIEYINERFYAKQPNLDEILGLLPNFELIGIYDKKNFADGGNALLKNTKII